MEAPIFILFAYRGVGVRQGALAGMAGTAITHPLLWFVWRPGVYGLIFALAERPWFREIMPGAWREAGRGQLAHDLIFPLYIASGELLVAVIEAGTFWALARPIPFLMALSASFLANGASYGIGQLARAWNWRVLDPIKLAGEVWRHLV